MAKILTESQLEQLALDILSGLDYKILHGPDIACDGPKPERKSYSDVILIDRLQSAIDTLNPKIPGGLIGTDTYFPDGLNSCS